MFSNNLYIYNSYIYNSVVRNVEYFINKVSWISWIQVIDFKIYDTYKAMISQFQIVNIYGDPTHTKILHTKILHTKILYTGTDNTFTKILYT